MDTTQLLLLVQTLIHGWKVLDQEKPHPVQVFLQVFLPLELYHFVNQRAQAHTYLIPHFYRPCFLVTLVTLPSLMTKLTLSIQLMASLVNLC